MRPFNDFIQETNRCVCFQIEFEEDSCFCVDFAEDSCFSLDFGELIEIDMADYYDGDYVIIPKNYTQMLSTNTKKMRDDVMVTAIQYSEVDNEAGGQTVTIGFI